MNTTRAIVYFVGIALVLVALWMFFVQAGLNRWVPIGIALAAVVLIVGVSVMSFAEKSPGEREGRGRDVVIENDVDARRHD